MKMAFAIALVVLAASNVSSTAQVYPSRPITLIVPFSAGGPTDTIGRIFAERIRASLGQTVIVENVTGAAGSIGVGRAARAAPDGYQTCFGRSGGLAPVNFTLFHGWWQGTLSVVAM